MKRIHTRSSEEEINQYKNKIKKLELIIQEKGLQSVSKSVSEREGVVLREEDMLADTPAPRPNDWMLKWPHEDNNSNRNTASESKPGPRIAPETPVEHSGDTSVSDLDIEILEILGEDPKRTGKFGPKIRRELANRLLHIVQEGLGEDQRKELTAKYVLPKNCVQIDAPKLNSEIKAAIVESAIKRDKGIEAEQKQRTSAIVSLAEVIDSLISSKTRNLNMLQKLMDVAKMLCNLQHQASVTRRNYILFELKDDLREHLQYTKIDTFLFGENLAETLKSAKIVNVSEMARKADTNKAANSNYIAVAPRPLNRQTPPQARRPSAGTAQPATRSREPAAPRAYYPPPPMHHLHAHHGAYTNAHSSRTKSHHAIHHRRRY